MSVISDSVLILVITRYIACTMKTRDSPSQSSWLVIAVSLSLFSRSHVILLHPRFLSKAWLDRACHEPMSSFVTIQSHSEVATWRIIISESRPSKWYSWVMWLCHNMWSSHNHMIKLQSHDFVTLRWPCHNHMSPVTPRDHWITCRLLD